MGVSETAEVLVALKERIAAHHQIEIGEPLVDAVVETALPLAGHLPAKAIALLDSAAARAVLADESELSLFHVQAAAARFGKDERW
jgi:ATP-dependent Clp protease ATP-binding subunit ClpA